MNLPVLIIVSLALAGSAGAVTQPTLDMHTALNPLPVSLVMSSTLAVTLSSTTYNAMVRNPDGSTVYDMNVRNPVTLSSTTYNGMIRNPDGSTVYTTVVYAADGTRFLIAGDWRSGQAVAFPDPIGSTRFTGALSASNLGRQGTHLFVVTPEVTRANNDTVSYMSVIGGTRADSNTKGAAMMIIPTGLTPWDNMSVNNGSDSGGAPFMVPWLWLNRGSTSTTMRFGAQTATLLADSLPNSGSHADAIGYLFGYNGATWDRLRSDTANGLDVDVTRVQGIVAADNRVDVFGLSRTVTASSIPGGYGVAAHVMHQTAVLSASSYNVNVTTAATLLTAPDLPNASYLTLTNNAGNDIFIGGPDVTTGTGQILQDGERWGPFPIHPGFELYAIKAANSGSVRVLRH